MQWRRKGEIGMYLVKTDEKNKANPVFYLYLLAIMAVSWIGLFFFKFRDSFVEGGGKLDRLAMDYALSIRNDALSDVLIFISRTGDTITAIIFTILICIYFYMRNKKREAKFYAINILGIAIISQSVKYLSRRPRPSGEWLVHIGGYSFPSGHALISMTAALILIYFILSALDNKILASIISIIIFVYASLIGLSRVYVGVHYISDIIGGWAIASLWVFITLLIFRRRSMEAVVRYIR